MARWIAAFVKDAQDQNTRIRLAVINRMGDVFRAPQRRLNGAIISTETGIVSKAIKPFGKLILIALGLTQPIAF